MVYCSFQLQRTLGEIGAKLPNTMQASTQEHGAARRSSFLAQK
jgi:hypothetical protein